jgi:outer membrane biosynthesis protein TonB
MRRRGPGLRSLMVSAGIHALVLAPAVVLARAPEPMEFETIRINLVSPPPADVVDPEPAVVETQPEPEPEPEPPAPQPEPEQEKEPEPEVPPKPPEKKVEQPKTEKPPEPPRQPEPEKKEEPPPDAERGGEGLNIATEGREFPYPDYLDNVIVQVNRYFRWNEGSRPKALIYFEITRDGSARNIRMVRSSGNVKFDFAVQGAVETAGNRSAFGPLPRGYAAPFLPVQMEVEPPR